MTAFELVPYDASRREDYLRLLRQAWGDRALDGETFDWWFDGNPEGSARTVALRAGEVVGAAGHSRYRAWLGGRERMLDVSVHIVTDPAAQGLGVFRAIETRHEEEGLAIGSSCVLCFANDASRPILLGALGWTQIDRRRVWARPLRAALGRLRGRRPGGDLGATANGSVVGRVERFGAAADRVYERHAPRLGNHLVRDARYLNWRYLEAPRDYRAYEGEGGFAVLGRSERRGASLAILLDVVGDRPAVSALVRACARDAAGAADALLAVPSACLPRALLARLGFAPTPVRLDLVGKGLADPVDTRAPAWTLTPGDTDFF